MFKNIFKASFFILISSLFIKFVSFSFNLICIRFLSGNEFGILSLLRSAVGTIEGAANGGLSIVTINEVSKRKGAIFSSLVYSLIVVIIVSLIILVGSEYLLKNSNESLWLHNYFYIFFILAVLSSFNSFMLNVSIGMEKNNELIICSFIVSIISLPVFYILAINFGLIGSLFGFVFFYFFDFSGKLFFCSKLIFVKQIKSIRAFPVLVPKIVNYLFYSFSSLFLLFYLKSTLTVSDNGFFKLASFEVLYQFVTIRVLITGVLSNLVLKSFSSSGLNGSNIKVLIQCSFLNVFIAVSISLLISFNSYFLLELLNPIYNNPENRNLINSVLLIAVLFTISGLLLRVFSILHIEKFIPYVTLLSVISVFLICVLFGLETVEELTAYIILNYFLSILCMIAFIFYNYRKKYYINEKV